MGKQKRGQTRVKPQVSSFGRYKNCRGVISTPSFHKNSNVAQVKIYEKNHYIHVLVCHTGDFCSVRASTRDARAKVFSPVATKKQFKFLKPFIM